MADSIEYTFDNCFKYDVPSRSAICRIISEGKLCRTKISNNHHGNKMRHLRNSHRRIFDNLRTIKRKKKIRNACGSISVRLSAGVLYAAFVELVSTNGRPFCICEDSGMRMIIDPIIEAICAQTGEKPTINEIIKSIKNKPLGLMTDISTKHNYSILGINIRYCNDDLEIVTRTIGMIALTNSHTAENLYKAIKVVLDEYDIKANQIFSYTTDNAGNIVNVVDFLNDDFDAYLVEEAPQIFEALNNTVFEELVESMLPSFEREYPHIEPIACGAHTLQLAVKDTLKQEPFTTLIQFVKEIVKELRTPTVANMLRSRGLKQAIIDHEIRWNYTYVMVIHTPFE